MKRLKRRRYVAPLVTLLALAPACASKPAEPPKPAPVASVTPDAAPTTIEPIDVDSGAPPPPVFSNKDVRPLLAPYRVGNDRIARATLFTWTSEAQADELKTNKTLLTRTESPVKGASYYDQVLAERASGPKNKLATLLRSKGYARARFAWPSPWPTRLGWPGESYGDVLIGVTLKPESLFVKMRTSSPDFEVVDMDDKPVPIEKAIAQPGRIAAIYFVNDKVGTRDQERWAFREYVLCNEAMIAEWSIGTTRESEALDKAAEAIGALAQTNLPAINDDALTWNAKASKGWGKEPPPTADAVDLYVSSLSAPNQLYWPVKPELEAIVRGLQTIAKPASMRHTPNAKFVKGEAVVPQPPQPKPPKPTRPRMGTF